MPGAVGVNSGIFSYFFQAGFGLAFGFAIVAIPTWRIIKGEKLIKINLFRRKY